jgi:heat shock protein HslJ
VIQTEEGAKTIVVPGLDINKALGTTTDATTTPTPEAPEGFSFTGKYVDGKPVFRNAEGQEGFLE